MKPSPLPLRNPPQAAPSKHLNVLFHSTRLLPVYHRPAQLHTNLFELEGAWRERRVVIWGTGPSALEAPREWDPEVVHIGVNGALGHPRKTFDAYCISDQRFVGDRDRRRIALEAPGVRVYLAHMRDVLPRTIEANFVRTLGRDGFCSDLRCGAYHGMSVVWVALQVALWAGARDVLLAGCEHSLGSQYRRSYRERRPAPADHRNWPFIRANYRRLIPYMQRFHVNLATLGSSRLEEAGVPSLKPGEVRAA